MHKPIRLLALGFLLIATSQCRRAAASATPPALDPAAAEILAEIERKETTVPRPSPRRSQPASKRHAPPPPAVVDGRPLTFTAGLKIQLQGAKDRDLLVVRHQRRLLVRNRRLRTGILFEQNRLAPWQISAAAVDHPHRCVIDFSFVDLQAEGMPHHWEDLVGLGLRLAEVETLQATGARRSAFGLEFEQLRRQTGASGALLEVWWNADQRLPLELQRETPKGIQTQRLVALRFSHEAKNLRHPHAWMKQYTRVDLADFREEHLGCGKRVAELTQPRRTR